jgi:hypothetical protein
MSGSTWIWHESAAHLAHRPGAFYQGTRDASGLCRVIRSDGTDLPLRLDVRSHSPAGFQWGYGGSGPAQLALAILLDAAEGTYTEGQVEGIHQRFKAEQIVSIDVDVWVMFCKDVRTWLAGHVRPEDDQTENGEG